MAKLHITVGPMFSGKTTFLLNKVESLLKNVSHDEILIINHQCDTRYSNNSICSHDKKQMPSISLNKLNDIFDTIDITEINKKKYIFIDEAQFFNDLYEVVKLLLETYKKTIYISGLDGDYKQEPFRESRFLDLIPYASTIQKLTALCVECKEEAPFTKRIINSNEQICVGGSDSYNPVCLNHK